MKLFRFILKYTPTKVLQHTRLEIEYILGFGSGNGSTFEDVKEEIKYLKQFSNLNLEIIYDIGANKGEWTRAAHAIFPNSKIFAFEPNPILFKQLQKLEFFEMSVKVFPYAIGSVEESRNFYFNSDLNKIGSLIEPEFMYSINRECQKVKVVRLDNLIKHNEIPVPNFIKIDVEGWELEVIKGLGDVLPRVRFIQFEISEATLLANSSFRSIQEILTLNNFSIFRHSPKGLIKVSEINVFNENFRTTNYLAVNQMLESGLS